MILVDMLKRKITVLKLVNKIPSSSGLSTNAALTSVENKKPDFSSLIKKTDYNTKISEIKTKLTDYNQEKKYYYSRV